jgi:hypothetical protein
MYDSIPPADGIPISNVFIVMQKGAERNVSATGAFYNIAAKRL